MDEADLVRCAQQGDRGAFGEIVRLHQARLRAFAARFVPRSEDVFDLVQDAFLSAFRAIGTFDPALDLGPWLRTIVRNRIRNHWRERHVRRNAHLALVDAALEASADAPGEAPVDALEQVEALRRCVDELQPAHRELIRDRYARGMAVADLARQLDRSAAALSMVLVRVRAALQKCLARRLGPEPS